MRPTGGGSGSSGGSGSQQCQQRQQRVSRQQLRQCEQYIPRGRGFIVLPRHEEGEESLQQCCEQLRRIDQQDCQCQGLRQIVQQQRQQGELQGQQLREVVRKAQNLPNRCGLGHLQCDISSSSGGDGY